MSSVFGERLKISIFGQSHSEAIGVVIDGLPAGMRIDEECLLSFMARRAPGTGAHATARKEADRPHFISGVADGFTCGVPICAIIENKDTRSGDYDKIRDVPRPSHADFAAYAKYGAHHDIRGGGHFSGRLTAPLCIAGALCMQYLESRGVYISAHAYSIADVYDDAFDALSPQISEICRNLPVAVLNPARGEEMLNAIEAARKDGDSVGGVIECAITGLSAGIGEPMFGGVENRISTAVFGIPAVKGIEFGSGFAGAQKRGSENNDAFCISDGIKTSTNNHGGILGGITSGMPVIFRAAIKPTPSIAKAQRSVSLSQKSEYELAISGRHDPCIVPRAIPCIEAAAAVAVCDMII